MSADPARSRRRCLFWLFETAVLLASFAVVRVAPGESYAVWPQVSLVGLILAFTCPLAVVLGKYWDFSPSSESAALWEQVRARTALGDDQFYEDYYTGSGIPKEIPSRLRTILSDVGFPVARLIPSDNLALLDEDLDFGDVLWRVGSRFPVQIARKEYALFDGTLDNLVREVHARTKRVVVRDEFF